MTGGAGAAGLLVLAQTLTNLAILPAGAGLPSGWKLSRMQGVDPPAFEVTRLHTLRVTAMGQGATATYRLRSPILAPQSVRHGTLTWRWRAGTPLHAADLKRRDGDDSPIRVVITFRDGRTIAYAWGNREGRGESFCKLGRAQPDGRCLTAPKTRMAPGTRNAAILSATIAGCGTARRSRS